MIAPPDPPKCSMKQRTTDKPPSKNGGKEGVAPFRPEDASSHTHSVYSPRSGAWRGEKSERNAPLSPLAHLLLSFTRTTPLSPCHSRHAGQPPHLAN